MVPSVIGTSYCLPVRLSVIVSVSAIEEGASFSRNQDQKQGQDQDQGQGRQTVRDRQQPGSARRPTAPGLRSGTVRCRMAASERRAAACGTSRTAAAQPSELF